MADKAMSVLTDAKAGLTVQIDKLSTVVADSPVADVYTTVFGGTTLKVFIIDWLPLLLMVILPALCVLFVACGICGKKKSSAGNRIVRKIGLAVKADVRMFRSGSNLGPKGSKAGKKEEAAIKKKAASPPGGKGGRHY